MKITGLISTGIFAQGTRSEHIAVFLTTKYGKAYRLTRIGGNPFSDLETHKLVGKIVEMEGYELTTSFRYDPETVKNITS
jgi:hypothetical protein